jgi:hypothetical protein
VRRAVVLLSTCAVWLAAAGTAPAAAAPATPALSGSSGGGTWTLLVARARGGLCTQVRTETSDGFASNGSTGCVRPALLFFGDVVANGNGIRTADGTPVVAATAGVVTARARRVVARFSDETRLTMTTTRPPAGLRTFAGRRIRVFGTDALAVRPGATLERVDAYDARGRRVARNKAPMFNPERPVRARR